MKAISWKIVLCILAVLTMACMPTVSQSAPAPVPPSKCEIKFAVWCIAEGAYKISRVLASDGVHDRIWTLSGRFRADSKLVIFEPNGCSAGHADKAALLGVEKAFSWQGGQWSRISVRLKHDTTCDLQILVPVAANDPMEWAYSSGLPLIRSCTKEECPAENMGDLKAQIAELRIP